MGPIGRLLAVVVGCCAAAGCGNTGSSACRTRELRVGLDGTVMQMLPASREQNQPAGSPVLTCTLRYWPGVLR